MGAEHDLDPWSDTGETMATVASDGPSMGELADHCPSVVVDALVETAWSFPGLRISCARLTGRRRLTFMASAGTQAVAPLTGETLDLDGTPRLLRLLHQGEPVLIEDVHTDSRIRVTPHLFEQRGVGSALLLPIRDPRNELIGALSFDALRPRTWSSREEVALERVAPLVQLALENRHLREKLDEAQSKEAAQERQAGAIRGVVDSAVHDSRVLLDALLQYGHEGRSAAEREATEALERQLFDVLGDLAALPDRIGSRRDRENVDLNEFLVAAAPMLRAILGPRFRLFVRTDPLPVWVRANRTGLDRLLRTLITHTTALGQGQDVRVRASATPRGARVEIGGDAVGTDDRLLSLVADRPRLSIDELGIDLWQARCEALLNGAEIRYRADAEGTRVLIELPCEASASSGA